MKKIKEVSEMAGVTRRALQYYDDMGLLKVKRSKENYRLYDEEDLRTLWKILFYRELGFELDEMELLMTMQESEFSEVLDKRIERMQERKQALECQIRFTEAVKQKGVPPISRDAAGMQKSFVSVIREIRDTLVSGEEIEAAIKMTSNKKKRGKEHEKK
jgi:Predicted transcriptional regulators